MLQLGLEMEWLPERVVSEGEGTAIIALPSQKSQVQHEI